VVVAVDGVRAPASGRGRRLLRRAALVATVAGAGWLLSVLFAGSASATPEPPPTNAATDTATGPADGRPGQSTHQPSDEPPDAGADQASGQQPEPPANQPPGDHAGQTPDEQADQPAGQLPGDQVGQAPGEEAGSPADQPSGDQPDGQPSGHQPDEADSQPLGSQPGQTGSQPPSDQPDQAGESHHPAGQTPSDPFDHDGDLSPTGEQGSAEQPHVLLTAQMPGVTQPDAAIQLLSWPLDIPAPVLDPPPAFLLNLPLSVLPDLPIFDMPDFPPAPTAPPGHHGGDSLDDLIDDLTDTIGSLFGGSDETVPPPPAPAAGTAPEIAPLPAKAAPRPTPAPATTVTRSWDVPQSSVVVVNSLGMSDEVGGLAGERAHKSTGPTKPVKVPAPAPAGGGSSASTVHDHTSGARGAHGVLSTHPSLEPPSGGFTTRGRAANASGRVAGLPATSPD